MSKENNLGKKDFAFTKIMHTIAPILLIALGILLIVNRSHLDTIFSAFGSIIMLIGLIKIVIYYAIKPYEKKAYHLQHGIIVLLIGAILTFVPFFANQFIPFCIGLLILISGISGIINATNLKKISHNWQIPFAFGILITLMGISTIICSMRLSGVIWIVIGVMLIISGIMSIINAIIENHSKSVFSKQNIDDIIDI